MQNSLNTVFSSPFKMFGFSKRFFAEGEGGGGGGDGESWHSQYSYLQENPEAAKAFAKYKTENDAFKGAHEAFKSLGKPYRLPEDHSKLTDEQKDEIRANVAKMEGVPETADGYTVNVPADSRWPSDAEAVANLKKFAKERNWPQKDLQDLVDYEVAAMNKLGEDADKAREKLSKENFDKFSEKLGGNANAIVATEHIKNYLQSFCKDDNGNPDPKMWEQFKSRLFHGDRMVEVILAEALKDVARQHSEGGAPSGQEAGAPANGPFTYPEMKKK